MSNNGLQPVWHWTIGTTLGDLTVVRGIGGLRGIYFPHHWSRPAQETFGPSIDRGFDETAQQLREYLAGDRQHFELPLHLPQTESLHTAVWELLNDIPYGSTTTYGGLAQRIGQGVNAQQIGATSGRGIDEPPVVIPTATRQSGRHDQRYGSVPRLIA